MARSVRDMVADTMEVQAEAILHFAEFYRSGLAYTDAKGNFQFLPLCHDDTEY